MIDKIEEMLDWFEEVGGRIFIAIGLLFALFITAYGVIFVTKTLKSQDTNTGLQWNEIKSKNDFRIFHNKDLRIMCFSRKASNSISCVPTEFLEKLVIKK